MWLAVWLYFFGRPVDVHDAAPGETKKRVVLQTHYLDDKGVGRCLKHCKVDCRLCGPFVTTGWHLV